MTSVMAPSPWLVRSGLLRPGFVSHFRISFSFVGFWNSLSLRCTGVCGFFTCDTVDVFVAGVDGDRGAKVRYVIVFPDVLYIE